MFHRVASDMALWFFKIESQADCLKFLLWEGRESSSVRVCMFAKVGYIVMSYNKWSRKLTFQKYLLLPHVCNLSILQQTATHCNTPHYAATHCSTPQHTATHGNTLQHIFRICTCWLFKCVPSFYSTTLQHTATHCNTLQHTATHFQNLYLSILHACAQLLLPPVLRERTIQT